VITPASRHSPLAQAQSGLDHGFWVWKVLQLVDVGQELRDNTRSLPVADVATYESQLHASVGSSLGPYKPCWDKMSRALFLATHAEKVARRARPAKARAGAARQAADHASSVCSAGSVNKPLTAYLRKANICGGGFFLTTGGRIPRCVAAYAVDNLPIVPP
jgi:hypothetical protein